MATQRVVINLTATGGAQTERAIRRVGGAAAAAREAVNGFRNVLVALAAVSATKGLVDFLDTITRIDNKLVLLERTQSRVNLTFNRLFEAASLTRSTLESTVELYARLSRSTAELGLSQQELLDLTVGVNQAFQIFGATSQEASAAVIQFSQGLAAGALRGDELRSVLEQAPRLAKAIADGLTEIEAFGPGTRVVIGDLRDLGAEGALTADLVTRALKTQLEAINEEYGQVAFTIGQSFVQLQNTFLAAFREANQGRDFVGALSEALLDLEPVVAAVARGLIELASGAEAIASSFAPLAQGIGGVLSALSDFASSSEDAAAATGSLTEKVTAFGLAGAALGGPIGALVGSLVGLSVALGQARSAQTELTAEAVKFSERLQANFDGIQITKDLLDENRVSTIQQAQALLIEEAARRENIQSVLDEAKAKRDALREELQGILARGQALISQREQDARNAGRTAAAGLGLLGRVPGVRTGLSTIAEPIVGLDENAALIKLESEAKNAAAALRILDQQVSETDTQLAQSSENTARLNALLADRGNLEDVSTEAIRRRTEAEKSQNEATREAERLAERQSDTLRRLSAEIGLIDISAGKGSDALNTLRSKLEEVAKAEALSQITTEGAAQSRERLNTLIEQASGQAFEDLLSNMQAERELLSLTTQERDLLNAVKSAGLDIASISDQDLSALRQELDLTKQLTDAQNAREESLRRQQSLFTSINGDQAVYLQQLQDLQPLLAANVITQQQFAAATQAANEGLAQARLEAGEGNFADALTNSLVIARGEFTNLTSELSTTFGEALSSIKTGFADTFAAAIVDGEDLNEGLKKVAREGLKQIISSLVQVGIQFVLNQVLAASLGQAAVGANATIAGQLAALYAVPAALASLASAGANALPANAALLATTGVAQGIAATVPAFAEGTSFVDGPGNGVSDSVFARLSRGEGVVTAAANAANPGAVAAMNRGERVGGQTTVNFVFPNGNPDTFRRSRRQVEREARLALDRSR
jgi:tape measure domain-containing protein